MRRGHRITVALYGPFSPKLKDFVEKIQLPLTGLGDVYPIRTERLRKIAKVLRKSAPNFPLRTRSEVLSFATFLAASLFLIIAVSASLSGSGLLVGMLIASLSALACFVARPLEEWRSIKERRLLGESISLLAVGYHIVTEVLAGWILLQFALFLLFMALMPVVWVARLVWRSFN
jgi:hypothetical protein